MTVIAYTTNHRVMAADSKCADEDGMHLTLSRKIFRLKSGALLGLSGDADARDLVTLLEQATPPNMPGRRELAELEMDAAALLVFPTGEVFMVSVEWDEERSCWKGEVLAISDCVVAIGSGAPYAIGAMDVGAHPSTAVAVACVRDSGGCAEPVHCEKLDQ